MGAYDDQVRTDLAKAREALRSAENELRDRRQADARLRELHRNDYGLCAACTGSHGMPRPCPTIQALNGDPK